MGNGNNTYSVTEAGQRLRATYPAVIRLLLLGKLEGEKMDGRWRISATSVERLRARRSVERAGFDEQMPHNSATAVAVDRSATTLGSSGKRA